MQLPDTFTSNKPYLFRAIYEWLLDNEATPYILVDATKPYVDVPQEHIKNDQIVLNANPSAVRDWHVDNEAVSFNARFSGVSRHIYVPMNALMAIYAQENGLGMAFPPQDELEEESQSGQQETELSDAEKIEESQSFQDANHSKSTNHLRDASEIKEQDPTTPDKKPPSKKGSHLKIVK
ncbi:ClpXP protease specificity-enhancing factor [Aliikangiella coralliicola]|uniref:ClpXP protease specificity-enhancing factor n=1 Tax=Aliikangiella coralliicola TaxID=2592383 RepID=A0A545UK27_9GAMM|nr:ClpXP protease specificity-enhancing factor [Aliikangiella coralliicola]TQV89814.1 ClpXP protease specificity-enhancing factor [Aliikangiella coralliicola]